MNILICYDAGPLAEKVLKTGIDLAKAFNAEITIYISITPKESGEVFEFIKDETGQAIKKAQQEIDKACQMAAKAGCICHTHISDQGRQPGEDIVDFAKQMNADYIIMGVHNRSRVGKLIFGSTAQYVILNSPCPVVTMR